MNIMEVYSSEIFTKTNNMLQVISHILAMLSNPILQRGQKMTMISRSITRVNNTFHWKPMNMPLKSVY